MRRRSYALIGCAAGLIGGLSLAVLCGAGERSPNEGRYRLHVWKTEGFNSNANTYFNPDHGAYRIDTQTGEVYEIQSGGGMKRVGS